MMRCRCSGRRFRRPTRAASVTATPTSDVFDSPLPTPTKGVGPTATPLERSALTHRVFLPLVQDQLLRYGWKGTAGGDIASPDWYYYWELQTPFPAVGASQVTALERLEAGLAESAKYVPMVWCTSDVPHFGFPNQPFPTPSQIAGLANKYPGRVWLMFNEPDNSDPAAGCGGHILNDVINGHLIANGEWTALGTYLAEEYAKYYRAIKQADPTARVFTIAPLRLPMPTLSGVAESVGVPLWNSFLQGVQDEGVDMDGIAIHAYPNNPSTRHTPTCHAGDPLEAPCVQEALLDAYKFFQGTDGAISQNAYPGLTRNKTIWITETGVLANSGTCAVGKTLNPERVRDEYLRPMVQWLNAHAVPTGDAPYLNAMAWYVTYVATQPCTSLLIDDRSGSLSVVGEAWRDATCPSCACPGPDCR